ncbi:putative bifunctional diguanylate cyclase/phosphodiesterase [Spirilliplanes yamanashiensis]|nr:bifunctional diguanylate cyclase/phosphodiesterase [Spirilliplanes yamanashiensis]MDP9816184.1 diguanylate cyclase (GGDEF)-like protein [Spirilliplanes yamanashiensis]
MRLLPVAVAAGVLVQCRLAVLPGDGWVVALSALLLVLSGWAAVGYVRHTRADWEPLDRLRRVLDGAAVVGSLLLVAWPAVLSGGIAPLPLVALLLQFVAAAATVLALATRWAPAPYLPVVAGFGTAATVQATTGGLGPVAPWLLLSVASAILARQFLGTRTNQGLLRDLTKQRAQLARQAFLDPLTGLGNRAQFARHAAEALEDATPSTTTAVMVFDLDGFKQVNDTWGHAAGDELLRTAAERLKANVRANDTVVRLGGDEFVVLLPRTSDVTTAEMVAERILADLAQPLVVAGTVLTIRASAGLSVTEGGAAGIDQLMREADQALYSAKAAGKGVVRRYDPVLQASEEQRRREAAELWTALEEEQFELHYQPIVDLDGEHTVGVEALVRWNHPTRGLLGPVAFLDTAETLGMLPRLGAWILREACAQAVGWQAQQPGLELNVNLSASQLADPHLVERVREVLDDTGIDPALLVLELTETVALTDLIGSAEILGALKKLGVRIALDDFGTGYSSLSHLGALPVDVVKIDRSFVQAMDDSDGATVAEAVLQIARTFGLAPVAEGVEDQAQAARLRDLDCAQAQGFLFARPMPAADLGDLLVRQNAGIAR